MYCLVHCLLTNEPCFFSRKPYFIVLLRVQTELQRQNAGIVHSDVVPKAFPFPERQRGGHRKVAGVFFAPSRVKNAVLALGVQI